MKIPNRRRWIYTAGLGTGVVALSLVGCAGACLGIPCLSLGLRHGAWMEDCPEGEPILGGSVSALGLVRGYEGEVLVEPAFQVLFGDGRDVWTRQVPFSRGYGVTWAFQDERGEPVPGLLVKSPWFGGRYALTLPAVPDGDYALVATLRSRGSEKDIRLDLPLYTPALAHLALDRPLYRPGDEVLLRSILFRQTDLSPLEGRPGTWRVLNPRGEEVMAERDRSDAWGIADSDFPLDRYAEVGRWTAVWESGGARDAVSFDVRPFVLPTLTASLAPAQRWYRAGERVVWEGAVRTASGAPLGGAPVEIHVRSSEGRWPIPQAWEQPFQAVTDSSGRFKFDLGVVPADLMERNRVVASAVITAPTGERVGAEASVVLSSESLRAEALTELGEGLVGGVNNRVWVRATTPDGLPFAESDIEIVLPWQPEKPPYHGKTDVDGVVAVQLDPGDPVTVVIPAPPFRPRPPSIPAPTLQRGRELRRDADLSLAERRAFDRLVPAVAQCGMFGDGTVQVGVQGQGNAVRTVSGPGPQDRCVAAAMRGLIGYEIQDRTYDLTWNITDLGTPYLTLDLRGVGPTEAVQSALRDATAGARGCLRGLENDRAQALSVHWAVEVGSTNLRLGGWHSVLSAEAAACVQRAMSAARLAAPAEAASVGSAVWSAVVPRDPSQVPPSAQTQLGYELTVRAMAQSGAVEAEGLLRMSAGAVPALRLRATPTLVDPGGVVEVELLRGPDYYGSLPKKLELREGSALVGEAKVADRKARFTVPEGVTGFLTVDYGGARGVVYARPKDGLELALSTDAPRYRPGAPVKLQVRAARGGAPAEAAVGLMGVDATLGQLAKLLEPDELGRVTVRVGAEQPAFGAFDPKALVLGQVRGEAAAQAAVMRLTTLPNDSAGDSAQYGTGYAEMEADSVQIESFFRALAAVTERVHAWEASAKPGETLAAAQVMAYWDEVLREERRAGRPVVDAYGRELTLRRLPLAQLEWVDPRNLVQDATHLPEDMLPWVGVVDGEVRP